MAPVRRSTSTASASVPLHVATVAITPRCNGPGRNFVNAGSVGTRLPSKSPSGKPMPCMSTKPSGVDRPSSMYTHSVATTTSPACSMASGSAPAMPTLSAPS